jgi:hypothetical protein
MNPYSHIVVASKLESLVKPEDPKDYYWGAVAPDIRYLAVVPRQQTHVAPQRIAEFLYRYPHLKSFLQGYLVHCLSDQLHMREIFFPHIPFSLLRSRLSHQHLTIILELFYFENEKLNVSISGTHNEVLTELGLDESASAKLSHSLSQYMSSAPARSRLSELFRLLGPKDNSQIEKYMNAALGFQENWLLRNAMFFGIRRGKISETIVSNTISLLAAAQSDTPTIGG